MLCTYNLINKGYEIVNMPTPRGPDGWFSTLGVHYYALENCIA